MCSKNERGNQVKIDNWYQKTTQTVIAIRDNLDNGLWCQLPVVHNWKSKSGENIGRSSKKIEAIYCTLVCTSKTGVDLINVGSLLSFSLSESLFQGMAECTVMTCVWLSLMKWKAIDIIWSYSAKVKLHPKSLALQTKSFCFCKYIFFQYFPGIAWYFCVLWFNTSGIWILQRHQSYEMRCP